MKPLQPQNIFPPARTASARAGWICLACQNQLQSRYQRQASTKSTPTPQPHAPRSKPRREAPPLQPLLRPIGVDAPPRPGDNPARDPRSFGQRRRDYFDRDKHSERRRKIINELSTPYFRDWNRMRYHRGKTFLAPDRLLKAETAKYMPNMQGYTLAKSWSYHDTIKVLKGKVSIVSIASGTWAQRQVATFVGEKENSGLAATIKEYEAQGLQRVWLNVERDFFKAILVRLFLPWARRALHSKEEWKRSFVLRKGVDRDLLEKIGMTNTKVGWVYLVDRDCRIRWASNGDANEEEKTNLLKMVRRLVDPSSTASSISKKQPQKLSPEGMVTRTGDYKAPHTASTTSKRQLQETSQEGRTPMAGAYTAAPSTSI